MYFVGAATVHTIWPNSLLFKWNISPVLVGFLLIYIPGASKQSNGLSSPIKTAPQLFLPGDMNPNFKHKATAETEYKGAGGQSFMIDVLLESYKKEKHFAYFMEVFYVQI